MQIRNHRPDELPLLKEIMVEAFSGVSIDQGIQRLYGPINGHDWQWRKARHLDTDVERDPDGLFVLEVDGKVAGFISTFCDHEAGIGFIPNLALKPEFRGRGLGRKLIEFALDHFRDQGLSHAKIETLLQNDVGSHLYTAIGFQEVAQQVHFICALESADSAAEPGN